MGWQFLWNLGIFHHRWFLFCNHCCFLFYYNFRSRELLFFLWSLNYFLILWSNLIFNLILHLIRVLYFLFRLNDRNIIWMFTLWFMMVVNGVRIVIVIFRDVFVWNVFYFELLTLSFWWLHLYRSNLLNPKVGLGAEFLYTILTLIEDDEVYPEPTIGRKLHTFLNKVLRSLALWIPKLDQIGNSFRIRRHSF